MLNRSFFILSRAVFNSNGIKGEIELHQPSIFEPTWLNFTVHSTKNELRENTEFVRDLASYSIRQLPPDPVLFGQNSFCDSTGPVYNPSNVGDNNLPPPGYGRRPSMSYLLQIEKVYQAFLDDFRYSRAVFPW